MCVTIQGFDIVMCTTLGTSAAYCCTLAPQYKQPEAELTSRTLWLSVWDWDRFGKNRFLGEVRLPLSSLDLQDTTDQWYQLKDKV